MSLRTVSRRARLNLSHRAKRDKQRKPRSFHIEPLEVRQMLTAVPAIVDLSLGHSAIYAGNTFKLTAQVDSNTPAYQVSFYRDYNNNGVLDDSDKNNASLGTATSGLTGGFWESPTITTGTGGSVPVGKQLFFAVATSTDASHSPGNVVALPGEVLTSAPVLEPIDNDAIVAGRRYIMTAKADLPPTVVPPPGSSMTYVLNCLDANGNVTSLPTGVAFNDKDGTMVWNTVPNQTTGVSHFQVTARYFNGATTTNSDPRDFYLSIVTGGQYLKPGGAVASPAAGPASSPSGSSEAPPPDDYFGVYVGDYRDLNPNAIDPNTNRSDYLDSDGDEAVIIFDSCGCPVGIGQATNGPSANIGTTESSGGGSSSSGGNGWSNYTQGDSSSSSTDNPTRGLPEPITEQVPRPASSSESNDSSLTGLTYNSSTNPHPIIEADVPINLWPTNTVYETASGWVSASPKLLSATVEITDPRSNDPTHVVASSGNPVYYSLAGLTQNNFEYGPATHPFFHLALPIDASNLDTGQYHLEIHLSFLAEDGQQLFDDPLLTGNPHAHEASEDIGTDQGVRNADLTIVNRTNSPVGNRWGLDGYDSLKIYDSGPDQGVMLITGAGHGEWIDKVADPANPGSFIYKPDADTSALQIVRLTTGTHNFQFISPDTSYEEFDGTTGALVKRVDNLGNPTTLDYYTSNDTGDGVYIGSLKSVIDEALRTQKFKYYSDGTLKSVEDAAGRITTLEYVTAVTNGSAHQFLSKITQPAPSLGAAAPTQTFTYQPGTGLVASATNELGETTYYEYDSYNRLRRTVYPDGTSEILDPPSTNYIAQQTITGYDENDQPIYLGSLESPAPVASSDLDGAQPIDTYSFAGPEGRIVDRAGNVIHFSSDPSGVISSVTHPVTDSTAGSYAWPWTYGPTDFYLHDLDTELLKRVVTAAPDGGIATTKYEYDSKFNLTEADYPDGSKTVWTYADPNNPTGPNPLNLLFSVTQTEQGNNNSARTLAYQYLGTSPLLQRIYDNHIDGAILQSFTYTNQTSDLPFGLVDDVSDGNNNQTIHHYYTYTEALAANNINEYGMLKEIIQGDASGPKTQFTYNTKGEVVKQTDPAGRITTYDYDNLGRLIESQQRGYSDSGSGPTTTYKYDPAGRLVQVTDPDHRRTIYLYGLNGQVAGVVSPDPAGDGQLPGPETVTIYNGNMQPEKVIDALGHATTYQYGQRGQMTQVTQPDPQDGHGSPVTKYTYNAAGYVERVEDPDHNYTLYGYDAVGNVTSIRKTHDVHNPDGTWSLDVSSNNQPEGLVESDVYNGFGQIASRTVAVDNGIQNGNQVDVTQTTDYGYDDLGQLRWVYLPDPTTGYASDGVDDFGQPLTRIAVSYAYDAGGRVTGITRPSKDGTATGATTSYSYDFLNRLLSVTQPADGSGNNPTSTYVYDNDTYASMKLIDPDNNYTTWTYDAHGRVDSETKTIAIVGGNPFSATRNYKYDAAGLLTEFDDRNGRANTYSYDALGRMTTEKWFPSTTSMTTPSRTLTYQYDVLGNLKQTSDPSATYNFNYDALNRQTNSTVTLPGLASSVLLHSGYDSAGNRTQLSATIGTTADFTNDYVYDHLNRAISISQHGGTTVATKQVVLAYNDLGELLHVNRFNHLVDPNAADITVGTGTTGDVALSTSVYTYDAAGRMRNLVSTLASATNPTITQSWTYDNINRAKTYYNSSDKIYVNGTQTFDGVTTYNYDDTNQLSSAAGATTDNYTYDAAGNRLLNGTQLGPANRLAYDGTYNYVYDYEGNLVRRYKDGEIYTLTYDNRNRLVEVALTPNFNTTTPTWDLKYEYDTFNNRVARTETHNTDGGEGGTTISATTAEKFIYDGDHVVLDFYKPDGGSFGLEHRYLYGPAVDQVLAQENVMAAGITDSGRVSWLLADNQGTVRDIINNAGALTEHYKYDAYGNILAGNETLTRYLYTGREFDATTGLQYNRNRWYDSKSGRWLSEDPIGLEGGDYNLYRYVGNDPTNAIDPSGTVTFTCSLNAEFYALFFHGSVSPIQVNFGLGWQTLWSFSVTSAGSAGFGGGLGAMAGITGQVTSAGHVCQLNGGGRVLQGDLSLIGGPNGQIVFSDEYFGFGTGGSVGAGGGGSFDGTATGPWFSIDSTGVWNWIKSWF